MIISGYQGRAIVAGYHADADLSATRQFVSDGRGGTVPGAVKWFGTIIILDLRVDQDLLELRGTVEVTIGDRTARATIIDANPGSGSLDLQGEDDPPFDIEAVL